MGLDELSLFNPDEKINEYKMKEGGQRKLVDLAVRDFIEETEKLGKPLFNES